MKRCDVVVIGAGPYGLAATTHLRTIPGLDVQVFGQPMSFWERNMPVGMFLRSNWTATRIADPNDSLTLEAFQAGTGSSFSTPVPLKEFVEYGRWYQRQAVPDVDERMIAQVDSVSNGFMVTTDDDEAISARRVVVAAGISSFAWRPPQFQALPPSLASHTSEHRDLATFVGKEVLVVGSGQSALESAALLHESGAQVEILARAKRINWLQGFASLTLHHRMGTFTRNLLYAPTDVGPAVISQLVARPDALRHLPRGLQDRLRKRAVRPAGSRWLVKRLEHVPIRLGCSVLSSSPTGCQVRVKLDDGTERTVDHILLGTGYRVDVSKYPFLAPRLIQAIDRHSGYPILKPGLETSVPGLHILGAPGVWSFGPLTQFVSGTHYSARSVVRAVAAKTV